MKPCKRCEGTGKTFHKGFTTVDGSRTHPDRTDECHCCEGRGTYPPVDVDDILGKITKGTNGKRTFRKSAPDHYGKGNLAGNRAYFVWRLARFHGGADVCMPMVAECLVSGDPYEDELNLLAERVAKRVFGSDMAAANRWGMALGYLKTPIPGLPARAYEDASAHDDNKPIEEFLETR